MKCHSLWLFIELPNPGKTVKFSTQKSHPATRMKIFMLQFYILDLLFVNVTYRAL